jgi:hypothetical protein
MCEIMLTQPWTLLKQNNWTRKEITSWYANRKGITSLLARTTENEGITSGQQASSCWLNWTSRHLWQKSSFRPTAHGLQGAIMSYIKEIQRLALHGKQYSVLGQSIPQPKQLEDLDELAMHSIMQQLSVNRQHCSQAWVKKPQQWHGG